jgi:mannosyltransferase
LLVIAIGGGILWRRSPLLVAIYALSIPLTLALLILLDFRIWPRYFFVDIGFVFLCLAVGAEALCVWAARLLRMPQIEKPLFVAGVLIGSIASLVLLARNYAHPKQDFAGAMRLIAAERLPGDSATSLGLASEPIRSYFAPAWPVVRNDGELAALEQRSNRVWLVTAFDDNVLAGQADVLIGELDGTLGGGTVKIYRSE